MDRQIQGRTDDEVFVVEVPGVRPGRGAADAAHESRRRDTDGTEEWRELQCNSRSEVRRSRFLIHPYQLEPSVRKVFGQSSTTGQESGDAKWVEKFERNNAHLE